MKLTVKFEVTYPDFIVVRKDDQLGYVIDILELHNPEFKDNLGKAKGFAKYAEEEVRIGRIQLIRMSKDPAGKNRLKRLDLAKGSVRNKLCLLSIMMSWIIFLIQTENLKNRGF